jgi:hypothetical protein
MELWQAIYLQAQWRESWIIGKLIQGVSNGSGGYVLVPMMIVSAVGIKISGLSTHSIKHLVFVLILSCLYNDTVFVENTERRQTFS